MMTKSEIAGHAQHTVTGREAVSLEPAVQRRALPWSFTRPTIDMVDGQKRDLGLTTTDTLPAVRVQDLFLHALVAPRDPCSDRWLLALCLRLIQATFAELSTMTRII
jgi:hypothetical protein